MDPMTSPMPQAPIPLTRLRPDSTATSDRPGSASMNSSAEPKARITGRATKTKPVSTSAPNTPRTSTR